MSTGVVLQLLPELILALGAIAIYLAGTMVANRVIWPWAAGVVLAGAGAALLVNPLPEGATSGAAFGPLMIDALSNSGRLLSLLLGGLFVLLCTRQEDQQQSPEFYGTLLLVVLGMMISAQAANLILLFLGLELISIPTYVLLYLSRRGSKRDFLPEESAAKYFFLSILASAIFLYGLSFLYGGSGTTDLAGIRASVFEAEIPFSLQQPMTQLALLMIFAGLGFKIAAVPFHFYAPDVYQGTSHAAAGLLSVAPKVGGFFALARIVVHAMPGVALHGWWLATVVAMLTMTLGNVMALRQTNIRRMMAYSSIAHAGYMLIGIAIALAAQGLEDRGPTPEFAVDPLAAVFFYLTVYSLATIGMFAALANLSRDNEQINTVEQLAGLRVSRPVPAIALAVCLFSLAGVPPLVGFWGKFTLFFSALNILPDQQTTEAFALGAARWAIVLAVVGVVNAAIALTYYLRVVGVLFLKDPPTATAAGFPASLQRSARGPLAATLICAVLVLGLGVVPQLISGTFQNVSTYPEKMRGAQVGQEPSAGPELVREQARRDKQVIREVLSDRNAPDQQAFRAQ